MKVHDLEVFSENGAIVIAQTRTCGMTGTDERVEVAPEQINMLIEWLKQARDEIKK